MDNRTIKLSFSKVQFNFTRMKFCLLFVLLSSFNTAFSQVKIGVINKQQLTDTLPSRKLMLQEIELIKINMAKELGAMDSTLVVLVDEYQKNITTWSEIVKQYQEARITKMQQRIEEREDQFEIELKQIEAESILKSEQIIKQAAMNVSTKLVLDVVIDSSQTIYFKEKLDITKLVLTEMVKIDQTTK